MATRKKAKRKAAVKGLPKTKTIGGKRFTKSACGKTKADAQKTAKAHRAKGKSKNARVIKDPTTGKYCVFKRG